MILTYSNNNFHYIILPFPFIEYFHNIIIKFLLLSFEKNQHFLIDKQTSKKV